MFKKILIANDGSEGAFTALDAALRLAHSHKAQLHMISVEEIQWIPGSREEVIGDKELADRKFAAVVEKALTEAKHHRGQAHDPHCGRSCRSGHRRFHRARRIRSARNRIHGPFGALQPGDRQHY
jgi:nucleotide-binding universal stress UspA family protein